MHVWLLDYIFNDLETEYMQGLCVGRGLNFLQYTPDLSPL